MFLHDKKIQGDFQISISVPLNKLHTFENIDASISGKV